MSMARYHYGVLDSPALWPDILLDDPVGDGASHDGGESVEPIISVRDICARLNIDRETLRRWAQKAGYEPLDDPIDGRISGYTEAQVRAMARAHQRMLVRLPTREESAQLRALRQEVAELRRMLESHLASHATAHALAGDAEPPVRRAPRPTVRLPESRSTLPEGWIAVAQWAKEHGIPLRTITESYKPTQPGRSVETALIPHRGHWPQGRAVVVNAWDPEQQAIAERRWGNRTKSTERSGEQS